MGPEWLSPDEVALVLRRATELDVAIPGTDPEERLSIEAVEAAAAEVGVPAIAVRRAVAELRAGVLTSTATGGPPEPLAVVEASVVPVDEEAAMAEIGRWLSAQTFHRYRGRDGVEVWRPREDWLAAIQRRLDWSAAVRLRDVGEVVVRAVALEEGTLLRLEATLVGVAAAAPGIGAGTGAVVGTTAGMAAGMSFAGGPPSVVVVGALVGGAAALSGWSAGRSVRRGRRDRIADELAAELDRIVSGISERNALDRLRERARRSRGRSWA